MASKPVRSFEDLLVWQKGIAPAKHVCQLTRNGPLQRVEKPM